VYRRKQTPPPRERDQSNEFRLSVCSPGQVRLEVQPECFHDGEEALFSGDPFFMETPGLAQPPVCISLSKRINMLRLGNFGGSLDAVPTGFRMGEGRPILAGRQRGRGLRRGGVSPNRRRAGFVAEVPAQCSASAGSRGCGSRTWCAYSHSPAAYAISSR
jgi:hypothetical protein